MRYLLHPDIALRSWRLIPYAYYQKHCRNARGLKEEEFALLCLCDGKRELEDSELLFSLIERGFVLPCRTEGASLTKWQEPRFCDNRYFPALNWMITGRCNYNCLHCFNAADNAPLMSEFGPEEAERLLDEAAVCGINEFTITGGEPMLHPSFFSIMEGIYARGMYVGELNTNGHFVTCEALDRLTEIGCRPLMKISFDGFGHHDWLRGRKGAEETALRAIRLCIDKGFPVKVQTNVHRNNLDSILPTAEWMDAHGVSEMRLIRTTEAPRWLQNAGNATLGLDEYFDHMLTFTDGYIKRPRTMAVDMWQFLHIFPQDRSYHIRPVECRCGEYRDSLPVCRTTRGTAALAANGNLFPCHPMSGYYEAHKDILGNVKDSGLQPLLQAGKYLDEVCTTVGELKQSNEKCRSCRYFPYCAGGCRALALALTRDKLGCDLTKCLFFEKGYHKKIKAVMRDWHDLAPLPEEPEEQG